MISFLGVLGFAFILLCYCCLLYMSMSSMLSSMLEITLLVSRYVFVSATTSFFGVTCIRYQNANH
jgi:hypothetical protein